MPPHPPFRNRSRPFVNRNTTPLSAVGNMSFPFAAADIPSAEPAFSAVENLNMPSHSFIRNTPSCAFRNTSPAAFRNTSPAAFRNTSPAAFRNTPSCAFRYSSPAAFRNTSPAAFRNTSPAAFRGMLPSSAMRNMAFPSAVGNMPSLSAVGHVLSSSPTGRIPVLSAASATFTTTPNLTSLSVVGNMPCQPNVPNMSSHSPHRAASIPSLASSSPSLGVAPVMSGSKNNLLKSTRSGHMTQILADSRNVQPHSRRRRGMATVMVENHIPSVISYYMHQCQVIIEKGPEELRHIAINNISYLRSVERNSLIVRYDVQNAGVIAARQIQTWLTAMMSPQYAVSQTLQQESLTLFSLELMFALHIPREALRPKPVIWNFSEEKEMTLKEVVEIFWITGLPNCERPKLGVAVCFINGDSRPKQFVSDHEIVAHAESTMIDYLKRVLTSERLTDPRNPEKIVHIEVFQNYSPCGECSAKYCRLLGHFANIGLCVKITIHFVAMYKVYWDIENPKPNLDWLPLEVHCSNRDGILRLLRGGVEMSTFTICTWLRLLDKLGLSIQRGAIQTYIECGRNAVDAKTAETFNKLIEYGSTFSDSLELTQGHS